MSALVGHMTFDSDGIMLPLQRHYERTPEYQDSPARQNIELYLSL